MTLTQNRTSCHFSFNGEREVCSFMGFLRTITTTLLSLACFAQNCRVLYGDDATSTLICFLSLPLSYFRRDIESFAVSILHSHVPPFPCESGANAHVICI